MVNVGFGWSSLVGIVLALAGVGLYFLRTFRPALARDHDIALAVVSLVCGGILFFNGWRQDPILQFGQLMLAGAGIWFAVEAIRLRGIATEQAKRTTPIVDDERPVSRVYRAELDDLALDDSRTTRRIRGSKDSRSDEGSRSSEDSRRPGSRSDRPSLEGDRPRRRRPSPPDRESRSVWDDDYSESNPSSDGWGESPSSDDWGDSRSASRPGVREDRVSPARSARRRPSQDPPRRNRNSDSDYVDYQPIDYSGDDPT